MTRTGAHPHRIDLELWPVTGTKDARNNDVRALDRTIVGIPARVDAKDEDEDTTDRDRTVEVINVDLEARWAGEDLEPTAQDRVRYRSKLYEILGPVEVVTDHAGRRDHLELVARRIVG